MKKLVTILLLTALCIGCLCISTAADDASYSDDTWEGLELQGLFYQEGEFLNSDLAEEYEAWWWDDYVEELDNYCIAAYINMRGFAMSADGKYAYMGTLNGGTGVRGVVVLDTSTGRITDLYRHYDGENGLEGSPFSYAKGIDTDDRGYVYTGFAFSINYNLLNLGIAKQQENGKLEQVYYGPVYQNDEVPGDSAGVKVGVNGVEVAKIGDRYFCYVMANYSHDVLYCYDVTDPAAPVLYTDFGIDGMIDFNDADCSIEMGGKHLDEGQYMEVDADGTLWLCASFKEGGSGIIKIDRAGITCQSLTELDGAYCIAHYGDLLFVGLKNGSAVEVLNAATMEKVASIDVPDADRVTRIRIINDTLYVCGAGNDSMTYNYIYAAPLTADAQSALEAQVAKLNDFDQDADPDEQDTTEQDTTEQDTTEQATTEQATTEQVTEQDTQAPEQLTTLPEQSESGCKGTLAGISLLLVPLIGICAVLTKKRD